jgi:aminoglycoside 3-N-acetyltransferase
VSRRTGCDRVRAPAAPSRLSELWRPLRHWLKAKASGARYLWVRAFLSYDEQALRSALHKIGCVHGDAMMVHCAFDRSHGFRGSIEQLTDVFIDAVGPDGHLLMVSLPYRSSSFDYVHRVKAFDVRKTPSMMGMVSELFRRRPEVLRSLHPTHPVLVRGRKAGEFIDAHPACRHPCGPGSPFDKLAGADGLVVFFNVPFATYTFFHYLEHLVSPLLPFPLYTNEAFAVPVIDRDGQPRTVVTHVFSPDAIRRRRFDLFEAALRQRGLISETRVGASRLEAVRVRDTIACVNDMAARGEFFYDIEDLAAPIRARKGD